MNPQTMPRKIDTTTLALGSWTKTASLWLLAASLSAQYSFGAQEQTSGQTTTLESRYLRFTMTAATGHCEILDKQSLAVWGNAEPESPFGTVNLRDNGQSLHLELRGCELTAPDPKIGTTAIFHPLPNNPAASLRVTFQILADERTLQLSCQAGPELGLENVSPLAHVLTATDLGHGYVVVPVREGLLIPADSGLAFTHRFDTYAYEGCHMEMLGVVQNRSGALETWDDPYVAAEVKSVLNKSDNSSEDQTVSSSLILSKSARTFRVQFIGAGDYVSIAKAYRAVAQEKGLLMTWDQKLKTDPERAKLFGAANIKLWSALDRRMNEESTKEESVRVNWTFEEAAQVAEHLKKDLQLEHVLFTIGGWIHRGYDNQHPDILPTAPECGGDAAFSDCARRVMQQGYLFCLHDNYQDIYRDSPSWDERLVMKTPDGKLAHGGHWAGGLAFLTCSQMAVELAERPQNLKAVKKLSNANAYFIDTTYASGLQECYDPAHPLTRADDIKWKQALSDYARGVFGVFGSECGREWAIPHSDFFEGLTGVSGGSYHDASLPGKLGATVVPLFDLVYRDCIAMYGKYGYAPKQAARYVLQHISIARPLNYHSMPAHLYWKTPAATKQALGPAPGADLFTHADNGWAAGLHEMDRFIKNTYEILSPLNEITARRQMMRHEFLSADRKIQRTVFGAGANQVVVTVNLSDSDYECASKAHGQVRLPGLGFLAEGSGFAAFYSRNWNGAEFASPSMFTLRSLDGRTLADSRKVRIFHAFGDSNLRLSNSTVTVTREETLDPQTHSKD